MAVSSSAGRVTCPWPQVHVAGRCMGAGPTGHVYPEGLPAGEQRWAGGGGECPGAAVTDDHKLCGFKRQKFIVSQFWRPESEIKLSEGHTPSESPRGTSFLASLELLVHPALSPCLVASLCSLDPSHGSVP